MTEYEIMDLRATYADRLSTMTNFWLTATFAAFGAAYYLQSSRAYVVTLALILFYAVATMICALTLISIRGFIERLLDVEVAWSNGPLDTEQVSEKLAINKASRSVHTILALMCVSQVAYIFYSFN